MQDYTYQVQSSPLYILTNQILSYTDKDTRVPYFPHAKGKVYSVNKSDIPVIYKLLMVVFPSLSSCEVYWDGEAIQMCFVVLLWKAPIA